MPSCPFGQHFSHPPRIFLTAAFLKLISSHSSWRDAGQVLLLFQSHLHFGAMSVLAQRSSFWSLLRVDSLGHAVDLSAIGNEWGLHLSLNFSCPRVRVSYCPCIGIAYWLASGGSEGSCPLLMDLCVTWDMLSSLSLSSHWCCVGAATACTQASRPQS